MALDRAVFDFTYRSGAAGIFYYFTISQDAAGRISLKNIQTPTGRIIDSQTGVPQSVVDDIEIAIQQVENFVAQTSAVNGNLSFVAQTSQNVTFVTAMAGTGYRVHVTLPDFVSWRIVSKATTGFTIELGVTYTGTVGYDVFV